MFDGEKILHPTPEVSSHMGETGSLVNILHKFILKLGV